MTPLPQARTTARVRLRPLLATLICLFAAGLVAQEPEGTVEIRNSSLKVTFDPAKATFAVQALPSGKVFVPAGKLSAADGKVRKTPLDDKTFGKGEGLEVSYPNGNRDVLLLFADLPFVLCRSVLRNGGAEPTRIRNIRPFSATLDLGKPASELRALGTGGLTALDKNPGSYAWLAIADPQTRAGVVGGWVSFDRGSGVVFSKVEGDRPQLEAQLDYGRLRIAPGKDAETETFALGWFDDARLGMEAWAAAVAKVYAIRLRPQPAGYCTWYHAGASNEKQLAQQTEFAQKTLALFGFSVMQIDDGWQEGTGGGNGPKKVFINYNPKGPYSSGMKATADDIKAHGLTPGLWFMPFAGTWNDPFFKDHQDWFVKFEDGKPYDTAWGGTCLDMTHAGAREYLRSVVQRIAKEWGYTYFKMDGMWTGSATKQIYVNSGYKDEGIGDAVFANPEKTNIEAYRDGLKLVRDTAGDGVFILGCCAPQNMRSYGGAFGLVDAMRIGPDNGPDWGGLRAGPLFASRNYHLHGRIWYNDPDPVYVRPSVPLEHARLICSWVAVSGALNLSSEFMPGLPPERLELLKRTIPGHGLLPRPVDLFETEPARVWLLSDERRAPRRDVVALFNWDSKPLDLDLAFDRLGVPGDAYVAFDYWRNAFLPPFRGRLRTTLPKESCQVLALRPAAEHPLLVSTSRHVTQGIVDVLAEKWDAASSTLTGRSRLVAGDPCELRILALAPAGQAWNVDAADVSAEDQAAGVRVAFKQTGPCVRATIESAAGREAAWTLRFRSGPAASTKPQAVKGLKADAEPLRPVRLSWEGTDGVVYEIGREGGRATTTAATEWTDSEVEPEKTYAYTVTAVDLAGIRSDPAKLTFSTPAPPKLPPLPPKPDVCLSDLQAAKATTGWGHVGQDKSVAGAPLKVNGKKYDKGVGVHAASELVYACKPEYQRFVAVVGLDDEVRSDERPSVVFQVYADKKLLAESPKLTWRLTSFWHFDAELPPKTKSIRLVVTDAGDGIAADHADWVDAGFVTQGK